MSPSRPMNAVLVGTGMVADMHVSAIAGAPDAVHLRGVFSRTPDKARAFANRHGTTAYPDFDAVAEDPEVDFVILATPPNARAAYVDRLIEARKPILLEKPIERDTGRARAIVCACEAASLPLGVLLQYRMRPAVQTLRASIRNGDLGQIATVDVRVPWWREQSYYDAPGRGTYAQDGGGVLITQAIHTIDLMLHLCGAVTGVQAITATSAIHRMEAEDFAAAALTFKSGAVGALMASTTHFPGANEEITLNGTKGSATLSANRLALSPHDGTSVTHGAAAESGGGADPMAFSADWHRAVITDFAMAIRLERRPAITGRSALAAHSLIDAISASSRTGRRTTPEHCDD